MADMNISLAEVLGFLWHVAAKILDFGVILLAGSAAAIFGAWTAFRLQDRHERELARRAHSDAGRKAQFALYTQWEILLTISDYLAEQQEHLEKQEWYRVQPMLDFEEPSFFESGLLSFFPGEDADVAGRVHLAQNHYRHALGLLEMHRKYAVRFHEEIDRISSPIRTPQDLVDGVSPDTARKTQKLTYDMCDAVNTAIGTNEEVHEQLFAALKRAFPGEVLLTRRRKPKEDAVGTAEGSSVTEE